MSIETSSAPARVSWQGQWVFVSLDCETSGTRIEDGSALISVGAAAWAEQPGSCVESFSELVNPGEMAWSLSAQEVHGIPLADVVNASPAAEVDQRLYEWLVARGARPGAANVVPVGVNFAAFDAAFLAKFLPRSSSLLSHRTVDINTLCFTAAANCPPTSFAQVKADTYDWVNRYLADRGWQVQEHDAGFDAAQALVAWWRLGRGVVPF